MVAVRGVVSGGVSVIGLAIAAATPAYGQGTPSAGSPYEGDAGDAIVVTGTRITAPDADASIPILSISADDIARSGETNLTSLLSETPALLNSVTAPRTSGGRQGAGAEGLELLNLRNLGEQRTLVLVNGRRHVSSAQGSTSVDIRTIPVALVERVDVMTGGASAIYGADGVSGVVNFVLKRDFDGIDFRAQNGVSSRGDAEERYAALTLGHNFAGGAGNVALSYEYRDEARVRGDRRRSGTSDGFYQYLPNIADLADDPAVPDRIAYNNLRFLGSSPVGAVDVNFDFFPDLLGTGSAYDPGLIIPNGEGLTQGGNGTPIAGSNGDLRPSTETHNVNLLASYEFSPAFRVFAEGKYVSTEAFTEGQSTFDAATILYADSNHPFYGLFGPNPYLPDSVLDAVVPGALGAVFGAPPGFFPDAVIVFRDNNDFGRRTYRSDRETWRSVIGADGEIGDHARYEISYTYGQTKTDSVQGNLRIEDRYYAALDAVDLGGGNIVCRSSLIPDATFLDLNYNGPAVTFTPGMDSGCAPLNILGENVASAEALAFVLTDVRIRSKLTQHVVSGHIAGDFGAYFDLPGGPVSFAVGGEYRKEKSSFTPDQLLQDGLIMDTAQIDGLTGSYDVKEGFAELQAPLLSDVPGAHLLQFGAALRLSDYSTVGSTTAWKVDGTYAPIPDVRLRATYSEAVRAPNIAELFAPQSGAAEFIVDPCDIFLLAEGTEYRAANCAAQLSALGVDPATHSPLSNPTASFNVLGTTSGNLNLNEETAKTWTAGIVLTPSFAPRLVASFDWYDIKLTGAINTPDAQKIVDLCVDQPTLDNVFCQAVSRNATGPTNIGYIDGFVVSPVNVSRLRTSGADFKVHYSVEPEGNFGTFAFDLAGGYLDRMEYIATPGAEVEDRREQPYAPKWSGKLDLTWSIANVTANYGISYFSKTKRFTEAQLAANPDIAAPEDIYIKEKWEHDLQLAVDAYDDRVTVYGGVNNLFDRKPDIDELTYSSSFRGRFFYFGIRGRFGSGS